MKQKTNRKPVVKADLFREVTDKMIAAWSPVHHRGVRRGRAEMKGYPPMQ